MKNLFLFCTFSLILWACGTQKTVTTSRYSLQDVNWVMIDESGVVLIGEGEKAKPLTIQFPSSRPNTYSAFLGCNTVNGSASAGEYGQMTFLNEGASITKKMCPDMSYEKAFIDMIHQANKYQIVGGQLNFYKNDILLMSFKEGK